MNRPTQAPCPEHGSHILRRPPRSLGVHAALNLLKSFKNPTIQAVGISGAAPSLALYSMAYTPHACRVGNGLLGPAYPPRTPPAPNNSAHACGSEAISPSAPRPTSQLLYPEGSHPRKFVAEAWLVVSGSHIRDQGKEQVWMMGGRPGLGRVASLRKAGWGLLVSRQAGGVCPWPGGLGDGSRGVAACDAGSGSW